MQLSTASFFSSAALRAAVLFGAFLSLGQTESYAQASYLQQGFETGGNTPATGPGANASGGAGGQFIYSAVGGGSTYSGTFSQATTANNNNTGPLTANVFSEGTTGFGVVNNNGNGVVSSTLTFNSVSFPTSSTGNYVTFKLASYRTNNNGGIDDGTTSGIANNGVVVRIAYNGSSTFTNTLEVRGDRNGSVFGFNAAGVASPSGAINAAPSTPTIRVSQSDLDNTGNVPASGGVGLSTVRVDFGSAISSVRLEILLTATNKTAVFIDDVRIGSNRPLPVELKSFTAEPTAKGTQLKWATASEKNNVGFDVQRGTTANELTTIARVAGQGTTARSHSYEWLDAQPLTGLSYYRLRQIDTDGTESYSPVVAVKSAGTTKVAFFPNPTTGQIMLSSTTGPVHYRVLNPLGQTLLTGEAADGGTVDVQALRPGSYFLEMQTATGRQVQRFVRE